MFSCIGTDYQDDPRVAPKIEFENQQIGLKVNEQGQLVARYFNEFSIEKPVTFNDVS